MILGRYNPLTCTPCEVQRRVETAGGSARSLGDVLGRNLAAGGTLKQSIALGGSIGCLKWGVRVFEQAAGDARV
jgi:hypothetical protein